MPSKNIKVIHIADSVTKKAGGVGSVVKNFHNGLLKANIQSRIAACDYIGENTEEYSNSSNGLYEMLVKFQPNIIHIHGLWNTRLRECLKFTRENTSKLILSPYGMTHPWALKKSKLKKIFFKYAVINLNSKYISAVISENKEESIHISSFFQKSKKIFVINNPLELSDIPEMEQNRGQDYVYIGRISEQKGVNNLVELWSKLTRKNITKDSILNIYGIGFGKYYDEFKRKVDESVGVRFHGQVYGKEKSNVLATAKALILNSEFEGQPVIALEAMAHGLPVICNEKCGLNNEIESKHCFLVKSSLNPIDEFSQAFEKVNSFGEKERVEMKNSIHENYKSIKVIGDIINTYKNILK
tara:strand:- start:291 stop:1358 length:1068 start_codon:yes stop_codon:yes gene_type:complete